MADDFEMMVEEVWRLEGRDAPIVMGLLVAGSVRVGDLVTLTDDQGTISATVHGVEFHVRPPKLGLMLADVNPERLRQGQIMRAARDM